MQREQRRVGQDFKGLAIGIFRPGWPRSLKQNLAFQLMKERIVRVISDQVIDERNGSIGVRQSICRNGAGISGLQRGIRISISLEGTRRGMNKAVQLRTIRRCFS